VQGVTDIADGHSPSDGACGAMRADRRGQGLVEYLLILVFAVVVVFSAVMLFGRRTNEVMTNARDTVANAT
jgi:hypothetical protein